MRRTFILYASVRSFRAILGLTCVRYGELATLTEIKRQPEASEGDRERRPRFAPHRDPGS